MFRKLLAILLSTSLFLAAFAVFAFLLIPVESITTWLQHKVNESDTAQFDIGETERPSPGTIILSDITLDLDFSTFRKKKKKSEAAQVIAEVEVGDDEKSIDEAIAKGGALADAEVTGFGFEPENGRLEVDELELWFSPMDLLSPQAISVEFRMDLLGGLIDDAELWFSSEYGFDKPRIYIGNIESLDMARAPALSALFSAMFPYIRTKSLTGSLDAGSVLLEPTIVDAVGEAAEEGLETLTKYVGEISVTLMDVVARSPVFLLRFKKDGKKVAEERFRLTDLRLGECDFVIKVAPPSEMKELSPEQRKRDGTAVLFSKGVCSGESIDIALREKSYLRIPEIGGLKAARVNFWIKSAYSSEFFREEEKIDGVVVTQNKALDQAMRFKARGFKRAQDVDGYYWMHCVGPLTHARCKRQLPPEEKRRKKSEEDRRQREKDAARKIEKERKAAEREAERDAARAAREIGGPDGGPKVRRVSPPDKRTERPTRPPRQPPRSPGPVDDPSDFEPEDDEELEDEEFDEEGYDEEGLDDEEEEFDDEDEEFLDGDGPPLGEPPEDGDDFEGLEDDESDEGEEGEEGEDGEDGEEGGDSLVAEEGEEGEEPLDEEIE